MKEFNRLVGQSGIEPKPPQCIIIAWCATLHHCPMFTLRSFPQGSTLLIPFQVFHPSGEAVFKLALFSHLRLYSIRTDLLAFLPLVFMARIELAF